MKLLNENSEVDRSGFYCCSSMIFIPDANKGRRLNLEKCTNNLYCGTL